MEESGGFGELRALSAFAVIEQGSMLRDPELIFVEIVFRSKGSRLFAGSFLFSVCEEEGAASSIESGEVPGGCSGFLDVHYGEEAVRMAGFGVSRGFSGGTAAYRVAISISRACLLFDAGSLALDRSRDFYEK